MPDDAFYCPLLTIHICSCLSEACKSARARASLSLAPRFGRTSARNRAHDMPDDASVNLASVCLAPVRPRQSLPLMTRNDAQSFKLWRDGKHSAKSVVRILSVY